MKSDMDKSSYNNEFKDLQLQLYAISQEQFNGVSLFANYISESKSDQVKFGAMNQDRTERPHHKYSYQPKRLIYKPRLVCISPCCCLHSL